MNQHVPIVLVGDTILDRIAQPLPHTIRRRKTYAVGSRRWLGGVWNSARAIEKLGLAVHVMTSLPITVPPTEAECLLTRRESSLQALEPTESAVERTWLLLGTDLVQLNSGDRYDSEIPQNWRHASVPSTRAILVQDYGHGVAAALRDQLTNQADFVVWDPHPQGALPAVSSILTANLSYYAQSNESANPTHQGTIRTVLDELSATRTRLGLAAAISTLGHGGLLGQSRLEGAFFNPAIAYSTKKFIGAGDIFAAALVASLVNSDGLRSSARTAAHNAARLIRDGHITLNLQGPNEELVEIEQEVSTGGCFDLLHSGHVELLAACRQLGRHFTVLLNSDESARALKGRNRPVQAVATRARQLHETGLVDQVLVFDATTPAAVLSELKPDIFVKGSDYISYKIPEAPLLASWGGQVLTVPLVSGISTSSIISYLAKNLST